MQVQKFTLPFPSLQVRAGVLVVDGYGISVRVLYGKLVVEDGIGHHRRSIQIDRAGSGLERLVLLGKTGSVTLESLAWLRAMGASLIHLASMVMCSRIQRHSATTDTLFVAPRRWPSPTDRMSYSRANSSSKRSRANE